MKLAEALIERADLQKTLEVMRKRLNSNAKVQDGVEPNEQVSAIVGEMRTALERLEYLIVHINKTNERTKMKNGKTIAETIAKKDVLAKELSLLSELLAAGSELVSRYSKTEIKILPTFSVKALQTEVSEKAKELRLLDTSLQEANWLTDLL